MTNTVSLPLLSKLPPSPTSFITYHSILRKEIKKVRKSLSLTSNDAYSAIKEKFLNGSADSEQEGKLFQMIWLLVLNAERAWAYGMQLKTEYQTGTAKATIRHRYMKRFSKAASWAEFVKSNCAKYLDERGTIEIDAYYNWLQGTVQLEKEQYSEAAKMFSEANGVYQQLSTVGAMESRSRYSKRSADISNLLQYVQYELKRKSGDDSAEMKVIEALLTGQDNSTQTTMLSDKLEAVLEEERKKQAASMETVQFLNQEIPVNNERVRVAILKALSLENELGNQKSSDSKLRLYEKLLLAYGDGVRILQEDVRKNAASGGEDFVRQSRLLNTYLNYNYLMSIVKRNEVMVQGILRQMESDKGNRTPQEVAHLYDVILQNVEEVLDLPEIDSDASLVASLEAKKSFYRCQKLYYLALSYQHANKNREAYALMKHTLTVLDAAKAKTSKYPDLLEGLNELQTRTKREMFQGHAQTYLDTNTAPRTASKTVLSNLDQFQSNVDKVPELISFPPAFEKIPCKPMFFDIAGSGVEVPDFQEQTQKKKGWFGMW